MKGRSINDLKRSAKQLADQLFDFQPNAIIVLSTVSTNIVQCGTYANTEQDRERLTSAINNVTADGCTKLFDAAKQ